MASKLHNNAIITGYLDSFCLACGCFLKTEEEACTHIGKPLHLRNLDLNPYLDKFKGDRIRKVAMGYYCEFCNALFPIASKVNLHITEDSHNHNKGMLQLKLSGSDVIAFNTVLIKARSWHGVIDNMCTVCNIEFDDECLHRNNNKHLLNLVQKPVQFGANNAIFRCVDENAIQCLTCEVIIASNTMTQHFNDSEHLSIYDKCRVKSDDVKETAAAIQTIENTHNEINNPKVSTKKIEEKPINKEPLVIDSKSKILESITKYQKHMININLETGTASCKKCLVNIDFDYKTIEDHIVDHSSLNRKIDSELLYPSDFDRNPNKVDINERADDDSSKKAILDKLSDFEENEGTEPIPDQNTIKLDHDTAESESDSDTIADVLPQRKMSNDGEQSTNSNQPESNKTNDYAANFAEIHKITYNKDQSKAFCRVCQKRLPSSLKNMKEHVAGTVHKRNADKLSRPKPILKQRMIDFVESAFGTVSPFSEESSVVNDTYHISKLSFMMVTKTDSGLRCQICEVNVCASDSTGAIHYRSHAHQQAMEEIPVVTSISSEFIREVRPGVFHCGYCNLVAGTWADVEMHLRCFEHEDKKNFAMCRLHALRPKIAEHRKMEAISMIMRMMRNPFF